VFKTALALPLIKKPNLDRTDPANYRPISNLSTVSKVLERLALVRLRSQLLASSNFNPLQSAYRAGHSTETALLKILDSCYLAMDNKRLVTLIGLDISAAFDTISHEILLRRLCVEFGVTDKALDWVRSYLSDRVQFVKLGRHSSATVRMDSGVPQGSVLGALLFTTYVSPLGDLIAGHAVEHHQYADDTQLFVTMEASTLDEDMRRLESCSLAVMRWFAENGLLLNADKSEVLLIGTAAQLRAAAPVPPVVVAGTSLAVSNELKSLGVIIDSITDI